MRTRTSHSDSIVSEATRYDATPTTPPLLLVVGAAVDALSLFPTSPVVGASGPISAAMPVYGLSVAISKSAAGPTSGPSASVETDTPLDGVTARVRNDIGWNRCRGSV